MYEYGWQPPQSKGHKKNNLTVYNTGTQDKVTKQP